MSETIPFTIRTKLTNALGDVEDLAKAKGLQETFAVELFSLRRNVEDAVGMDDPELADKALRDARLLWGLLRGTPGRYSGAGALA
ncbi:MAG TPA: hypothetical protein VKA00_02665 [Trueperaceae bacterium]|nr:hypothetical protein [Trueperaceae bacterium]